MAQRSTNLLNKTIYADGNAQTVAPSSASVRLTGLTRDSHIEIDEILWGVTSSPDGEGALLGLTFGQLQILRNEIFDPVFTYGGENVGNIKDVVYHDTITNRERFRERRYFKPMTLNDARDYLIIVPVPIRAGDPGTTYRWALTVKGRYVVRSRSVK